MSLSTITNPTQSAAVPALESLFERAESYGAVSVFSDRENKNRSKSYRVDITFNTKAGISLSAKSNFGMSLATALVQAIARAEEIRGQFK